MNVRRFTILVSMAALFLSQACTTVASTGASALYNHESIQKNAHDQYITMRSYQAIDIDSDRFRNANVNISTFNRVVLISGQVPYPWQKMEAEKLIKKVPGIKAVHNLLIVEAPTTQTARLKDTWITAKIRSKLLIADGVDGSQVKVVTEHGRVFLMGTMRPSEADVAVNVATSTDGVESVVKIFSYLNLSKYPKYTNEADG